MILGASLRTLQYAIKSSFWGDELALISNVASRDAWALLTQPMNGGQMAPSGFLLLLKLIAGIAGVNEYTLRFIPWFSSLVALPLFARFSRKILSRPAAIVALGAFALSPPLIRYAGQAKPYASDIAICLVILIAAHSWMGTATPRNTVWLAFAGAAAIWFSYTAAFVLGAVGLVIVARIASARFRKDLREAGGVFAAWTISAVALGIVERNRTSPDTHAFMLSFWANWLMPRQPTWQSLSAYIVRLIRDSLSAFLHLPFLPATAVLLLIGFIYLARRSQHAGLVAGPILVTLAASMIRMYPFSGRTILFLVPSIYLLVAAGIEAAVNFALDLANLRKLRTPALVAAYLASAAFLWSKPLRNEPPPYRNSETRPVISYLAKHRQQGDAIYVHNMAWRAYTFYGPAVGLGAREAVRTTPAPVLGPKLLVILKDMDQFRGRPRVWILFGGGNPIELLCLLQYLESVGRPLDSFKAFDSSVYLYDLSGQEHPEYASAEDFFSHARTTPACKYAGNLIGPQK